MNPSISLIREIDALLPQTQCGLCGHRDGCLPYAKSIAEGEEANKCVLVDSQWQMHWHNY